MAIKSMLSWFLLAMIITTLSILSNATTMNAQSAPCPVEQLPIDFDGSEYILEYQFLDCGEIENVLIDQEFASLIITLDNNNAGEDRELSITMPRSLIDSKQNDTDAPFLLLVDGAKSDFEEPNLEGLDESERMIVIDLPANSKEVEVIGTQIVPEFPLHLIAILGATLGVITILARRRPSTVR